VHAIAENLAALEFREGFPNRYISEQFLAPVKIRAHSLRYTWELWVPEASFLKPA
jgi:hypothetical protein